MRATQQLKYAIYGIFDLAYHGSDRPIRIREIGGRQRIPARYLEQIFQRLRRAGLVCSKRGPGGGYLLARPPDEITLADVAIAIEGSILSGVESAANAPSESPAFVWSLVRRTLESALASTSIADLCREAAQRGVERADPGASMYYI
jgi:Rrf2 family iron-sulfur cluster assembly transcriptional regulator